MKRAPKVISKGPMGIILELLFKFWMAYSGMAIFNQNDIRTTTHGP
jgi:hypothetical protein